MCGLLRGSSFLARPSASEILPADPNRPVRITRGGLNFNLELRWDSAPSLADALRILRQQAARTPDPQWVRVLGAGANSNSPKNVSRGISIAYLAPKSS